MFSHPQGLQMHGEISLSGGCFLFETSCGSPCAQPSISEAGQGASLEGQAAPGAAGSLARALSWLQQRRCRAVSERIREKIMTSGRGKGQRAGTAVGNVCMPCGKKCGCLWTQQARGLGLLSPVWSCCELVRSFLSEVWSRELNY